MNFEFAAFADESDDSFKGQIDALCRNSYGYLEIRNVDGKNVTALTLSEAQDIKKALKDKGLSVWSVGSPIGKIDVNGDYDAHLQQFKHTLELAKVFGAKRIRLFSFFMPKDENPEVYEQVVIERLAQFLELAKDYDVTLCHENEKGIFGDTAERCLKIHKALPQLKAVFDPANFIQCGEDTLNAWGLLSPYVDYMHIKDALPDGRVVPPGDGIGNIGKILGMYGENGGKVLTLEPHLFEFVGLKNLEREGEESIVGAMSFATSQEAFDFAVKKLNETVGKL